MGQQVDFSSIRHKTFLIAATGYDMTLPDQISTPGTTSVRPRGYTEIAN
jgi:hypothetical protein